MERFDRETLIRTWIERYTDPALVAKSRAQVPDERFWVWEQLDALCRNDPELAWSVVLEILERTHSTQALECLAAGPLEDLLAEHGNRLIELVEQEAQQSSAFRGLLAGVWQNTMSDDLWLRVQAALKTK